MKVAILGAGFCGLAAAYYLLQKYPVQIDIFDPNGIGGNSAKISAGLLHKYSGPHAKLNRFAYEGESATQELLKVATAHLSSPVLSKGILRPCLTYEKEIEYRLRSETYPELKWIPKEQVLVFINGVAKSPALFIPDGLAIDCQTYLRGLWLAVQKRGANHYAERIKNLIQLKDYSLIIVATGADIGSFPEFSGLKVTQVKGQLLEFVGLEPPPIPVNSEAYLLKSSDSQICIGGATYEKEFSSSDPDLEKAKTLLLPKLSALYPSIAQAKIKAVRSGLRASTKGHLPHIGKYGKNLYAITGMGSKGLLYHAFYAKKLVELILSSDSY